MINSLSLGLPVVPSLEKLHLRLGQSRTGLRHIAKNHSRILLVIEWRPFGQILSVGIAICRKVHPIGRNRFGELSVEIGPRTVAEQVLEYIRSFGAVGGSRAASRKSSRARCAAGGNRRFVREEKKEPRITRITRIRRRGRTGSSLFV